MPRLTVSTKVISKRSGMPVRQVQTFTDAGVLLADEGTEAPGRGGSRQYPLSEEEVASLLAAISYKGMPVTEAKGIAGTLRRIIRSPEEFGFKGLDEARDLSRYLHACLANPINAELEALANPIIAELEAQIAPRWEHVGATKGNIKTIQTWIALELAKRGERDPIIFLYRGTDEKWCYDLWAIQEGAPDRNSDLQFEAILIELMRQKSNHGDGPRGGYVIRPRRVYAVANSRST